MKFDGTITISVILALCAVIAPVITAIINNRHQYKIRNLELQHDLKMSRLNSQYKVKLNMYQEFVDLAWKCINESLYVDSKHNLLSISEKCLLICNSAAHKNLISFISFVSDHDDLDDPKFIRTFNSYILGITSNFNDELTDLLPS